MIQIQVIDPRPEEMGFPKQASRGNRWYQPEINIALTVEEFVALRARVAEVWPAIYRDPKRAFGATASNLGCYLAIELGMMEAPNWNDLLPIARKLMPNDPFASANFVRVLTFEARLVAVDNVAVKRRKKFRTAYKGGGGGAA